MTILLPFSFLTFAKTFCGQVYLIDEPSAYLDSEQRIAASKVIKRFIMHAKKTAFVVEHDFIMATYLADRVVVYSGQPGVECKAAASKSDSRAPRQRRSPRIVLGAGACCKRTRA